MNAAQVLNGVALGSLLMVLSSGLAMIYGLRGVTNFAHGALYMSGAYIAYTVTEHFNFWVALLLVPLALAVIGVALELVFFRPLQHRSHIELGLITFGIALIVGRLVVLIWGERTLSVDPPAGLRGTTSVLGVDYPTYRLGIIVVALLLAAGLVAWLRFSRVGLHIRAASQDIETAGIMGIDVDKVSLVVVSLGAALAGLAGVLAAPYISLDPNMGSAFLIVVLIVVVVGGIGSVGGAMVAGMGLGVIQTVTTVWSPSVSVVVPYLALVVVLLWRPQGLAGKEGVMTTSTVPEVAPPEVRPMSRRRGPRTLIVGLGVGIAVLLAGLAVPYVVTDTYTMGLALEAALLSLLALGIGFLARHLGLISLGHTSFFGGAAYAVGVGINRYGWSPTVAVAFGVLVGTVIALVMGILVVRASGMGFLMLTLALSQALYQLCVQTSFRPLTGAYDGLLLNTDPQSSFLGLGPADVMNPGLFWPMVWVTLTLAGVALWLLGRSRFGTVLEGIRENEERMRFSGYNTFAPRLVAFVVSGFVASLGGALFALNAGYISPDVLGFSRAGDSLIAAMVGGLGTLGGPVLGTALFVWAQAHLNFGGNLHLFTGVALIAVLVFLPGGITGSLARLTTRVRAARRRATTRSGPDERGGS